MPGTLASVFYIVALIAPPVVILLGVVLDLIGRAKA